MSTSPELQFAMCINSEVCSDGHPKYAGRENTLHEWTGKFWRPLQIEELERMAWQWLAENVKDKATPRVAASCAAAAIIDAMPLPSRRSGADVVLPVQNGAIELWGVDDGDFELRRRPADRDDGLTFCLSCDYEPAANAEKFEKFLTDVLPDGEVRQFVQEFVGYTLLPDTRFQRAQFWLGGGANGKSTLAEIVSALHEKTSAMTLDSLDGFKLAGLLGASLVYVDETPNRIDEQRLKALISGGLIQIDRKYRDPLSLRPTAKWIICGNSLPAISDQSLGFWRRLPVVPFTQSFPDGKADHLLSAKIRKHELPGVLNWALAGLLRLLERGRFAPSPQAVLDAIEGGKRETNSVMAWWHAAEVETAERAATVKETVYEGYTSWCRLNGMQAVASTKFWKRVHDLAPALIEGREPDGRRRRLVGLHFQNFQLH